MAKAGEGCRSRLGADREREREHSDGRNPQDPGDHDQQCIADRLEQADDSPTRSLGDVPQSEREQGRENDQRQYVAVGCSGDNIVRHDAFEEIDDTGKLGGRLLLDPAERRLQAGGRFARQRESACKSDGRQGAEDRRDRADDDDPEHGTAGDAPALRRLRPLRDADDQ